MNVFECPFSLYGRQSGSSIAMQSDNQSWTYSECHAIIERIANTLKNVGVKPGDRIALYPTKSFPTPLIFFAIFRLGAIVCPLNTYFPMSSLPERLDALSSTFLLIPDNEKIPTVKQITLPFSKLMETPAKTSKTFLEKSSHATYLFTSGTTAEPKIACHSLGNHYYSALGSNARMPLQTNSHYLLSLPLYHIAGIAILFRTFLAGASLLLSDTLSHPQASHLSLVPTQLSRLLETLDGQASRHILLGGANISPLLYQKALQKGLTIYPTYGMTEMSSQIATYFEKSAFSLGHPLPYREIKIATDGEIFVRGKTLFQGYFNNTEGLHLPVDQEGWFPTRDIGLYSPKQGLKILGRKDRLFISGGENIQPEEIEKILSSIEGITNAKVMPQADAEFGFRPVAYITSEKGFNEKELKRFLSSMLPPFKVPVAFYASHSHTHKPHLNPPVHYKPLPL